MNRDSFRRDCGCEVQVAPIGIEISGVMQECKTPVYAESIIVTPCLDHGDHPHGVFRKEADA